jgi:hypothetical protein
MPEAELLPQDYTGFVQGVRSAALTLLSVRCRNIQGERQIRSFLSLPCARCRKDTSSAHGANLFSSTAKIEWLSGVHKVQAYKLSQTRHVRCFCSICGSAMPYVAGELLMVPAGCLETQLAVVPELIFLLPAERLGIRTWILSVRLTPFPRNRQPKNWRRLISRM